MFLRFLICFFPLWGKSALVQILREIFLFTSDVFDVASCILDYFQTTVLVAIV